jgi:hypothetical protein
MDWKRRMSRRWSIGSIVALAALIITFIGFRNEISDTVDWMDRAIHGPTDVFILGNSIVVITNRMNMIDYRLSRIERRLNIEPIGEGTRATGYDLVSTNNNLNIALKIGAIAIVKP